MSEILAWNYRVLCYLAKVGGKDVPFYRICEVYYESNGGHSWVEESEKFDYHDSVEDLQATLERAQKACAKPVMYVIGKGKDAYLTEDPTPEEFEPFKGGAS